MLKYILFFTVSNHSVPYKNIAIGRALHERNHSQPSTMLTSAIAAPVQNLNNFQRRASQNTTNNSSVPSQPSSSIPSPTLPLLLSQLPKFYPDFQNPIQATLHLRQSWVNQIRKSRKKHSSRVSLRHMYFHPRACCAIFISHQSFKLVISHSQQTLVISSSQQSYFQQSLVIQRFSANHFTVGR